MNQTNPRRAKREANQEDYRRLLLRLAPDEDRAWHEYASIHRRLVKFFQWNHCVFAEVLADETLDTVAKKPETDQIHNLLNFTFGVAKNILREHLSRVQRETHIDGIPDRENSLVSTEGEEEKMVEELYQAQRLACLRECLAQMPVAERALAIEYYSAEEEKAEVHRQRLAKAAGLTMGALWVRMNRLRTDLEDCVLNRLRARR